MKLQLVIFPDLISLSVIAPPNVDIPDITLLLMNTELLTVKLELLLNMIAPPPTLHDPLSVLFIKEQLLMETYVFPLTQIAPPPFETAVPLVEDVEYALLFRIIQFSKMRLPVLTLMAPPPLSDPV